MSQQKLQIQGMTCAACQIHVQRALAAVPGVATASVNLMAHTALVDSPTPISPQALIAAVHNAGYEATLPATTSKPAEAMPDMPMNEMDMAAETPTIGLRALLSLIAGAIAMVASMPLMLATTTAPASPNTDPLLAALTRLLMPIMPAFLMSIPATPLRWVLCIMAIAVMVFAAPEIYTAAWRASKHRSTNMNTLVALGTLAAFAASLASTIAPGYFARRGLTSDVYYEAVILILAFLISGRWLEARARATATSALRGFAHLGATSARKLDPKSDYATAPETQSPLDSIAVGDILRILPGDRIPLDGTILFGRSSVDESMLTGEPLPVTRSTGDHISAGTLNLDGVLVLRATAVGAASTLAQMQRLLDQAQSSRAPMQRLADRASAVFVPTVLGLAAATFLTWSVINNTGGRHLGFGLALSITISVLIIACPCAMGLAIPAAVTVSIGAAAKRGLLLKGGEALERLASIDTLALDKTGTLTEGRPRIAAFSPAPNATLDTANLLAYAVAAEKLSTHPLAVAVVDFAEHHLKLPTPPAISNFIILPGVGLTATATTPDGQAHKLTIGNASLLHPERVPQAFSLASHGLEESGALATGNPATNPFPARPSLAHATPLYLLLDDAPQAVFYATDELRPTAVEAIAQLKALHIRPVMLTGDTAASAAPIAAEAGIADVRASLLPAQKLDAIRQLQAEGTGHKVGMVGDGLNDAAALAQANSGLALASGSDLAREAGDGVLLHPDLRLIPAAIRLARHATHIMRQNLGWAVGYNLLGLPIAAGLLYPHFHILLSPVLASAAMALSSVSVLANSLRLRKGD